jgi:hypothetical protein
METSEPALITMLLFWPNQYNISKIGSVKPYDSVGARKSFGNVNVCTKGSQVERVLI